MINNRGSGGIYALGSTNIVKVSASRTEIDSPSRQNSVKCDSYVRVRRKAAGEIKNEKQNEQDKHENIFFSLPFCLQPHLIPDIDLLCVFFFDFFFISFLLSSFRLVAAA